MHININIGVFHPSLWNKFDEIVELYWNSTFDDIKKKFNVEFDADGFIPNGWNEIKLTSTEGILFIWKEIEWDLKIDLGNHLTKLLGGIRITT